MSEPTPSAGDSPDSVERPTPGPRRRVRRPPDADQSTDLNPPLLRPTPTDRIVDSHKAHIDSLLANIVILEQQNLQLLTDLGALRAEFEGRLDRLQAELDRLRPENARLKEALGNAVANGTLATILIIVGGAAVGFAAFLNPGEPTAATIGIGLPAWAGLAVASAGTTATIAGVAILEVSSFRGNRLTEALRKQSAST